MTTRSSTEREPKRARSVATRARVLAAAHDLFEERGWGAVTVRAISQRSGLSRGAIYRRFASGDEIRAEVRAGFIQEVGAAQQQAFAVPLPGPGAPDLAVTVGSAIAALSEVVRGYSRKLGFRHGGGEGDGPSTGILHERFARALAPVRDQIAHADPERAVSFVFRVVFETVAFAADGDQAVPAALRLSQAAYTDALTRMVVLYLSTPDPGPDERSATHQDTNKKRSDRP